MGVELSFWKSIKYSTMDYWIDSWHYDIQKWEGMLHLSLVHTKMVEIISFKKINWP